MPDVLVCTSWDFLELLHTFYLFAPGISGETNIHLLSMGEGKAALSAPRDPSSSVENLALVLCAFDQAWD